MECRFRIFSGIFEARWCRSNRDVNGKTFQGGAFASERYNGARCKQTSAGCERGNKSAR